MFHLLATTKCKRQQIAILIISFFAYVAGIRNEGNNMMLQWQQQLLQQQQTTIGNSDNKSPITGIRRQSTLNFRPSQVIDFTAADAASPQRFKLASIKTPHSTNNNTAIRYNYTHNNDAQNQETQSSNRRYAIVTAATYGNAGEKPFSFPNEQQQIPQHLTDKPIYVYRDPFTNENYHYTPTETNVKETTIPTTSYSHNNYNNNAYKQQNLHQHLQHHADNQEYLVQSSMTVGTHQQQQQQQQQEINPFRPYMSLSADKDVYLKRPGFVYDEEPSHNLPNPVVDKKNEVNKISYDSHDYPPPSYFQQQTSNFLPTPVPEKPPTSVSIVRPTAPSRSPPYQGFRPPNPTHSTTFVQQQTQQHYSQSSQSALPNYANSIDGNYLLNKQQTSEFYRTEAPPPTFSQQPQMPYRYEHRPPHLEYDFPQQTASLPNDHKQQYFARPPPFNSAQIPLRQYEPARPPPGRPSYNNYYDYQIGEIPSQVQTSAPPSQHFNYPYPRPPSSPPQYPYRPPTPALAQQSGLAALAQYAPQFTSLLLGGVGGGGGAGGNSNNNGPLGSLIGALTGEATSQQLSSASPPASFNRRPVNSQLIKALENIARNDDLQCVPKVLCQMIAAQTQRGQLPTFITSPAITNFLAGFPAASPALIYGRAALLGLSGGEKSCHQTYVNCPKDEYEIIYYLNNHRGGFFKFFSEPEEQHQAVNHGSTQQSATSLFSILSALAGAPQTTTTTTHRPAPKPQAPETDITSGIANFFTHLLSDYVGGATVEYQRRFKRRTKRSLGNKIKFEGQNEENQRDAIKFQDESLESQSDAFKFKDEHFVKSEDAQQENEEDFHDEEDDEDAQHSFDLEDYFDATESRIIHKNLKKGNTFFPESENENLDDINVDEELRNEIKKYNDYNKERKLKFPTATDDRMYTEVTKEKLREAKFINDASLPEAHNYGHKFTNYVDNSRDDFEKENQKIKFTDYREEEEYTKKQGQHLYAQFLKDHKTTNTNNIIFPERQGKILNRFYYAASYLHNYPQEQLNQEADQNEGYILPNDDQVILQYAEHPAPTSLSIYNTYANSLQTQTTLSPNSIRGVSANANVKNSHFLPTPPPGENNFSSSNSIQSNQNNNHNPHKINSNLKQHSAGSSAGVYFNNNNVQKAPQSIANRYHSSLYTTKRPYASEASTEKTDSKNIYVTNSRGVTEYYLTPDGRKIYL